MLHSKLVKFSELACTNRETYIKYHVLGLPDPESSSAPVFATAVEEEEYKQKTIERLKIATKEILAQISDSAVRKIMSERLEQCQRKPDYLLWYTELCIYALSKSLADQ